MRILSISDKYSHTRAGAVLEGLNFWRLWTLLGFTTHWTLLIQKQNNNLRIAYFGSRGHLCRTSKACNVFHNRNFFSPFFPPPFIISRRLVCTLTRYRVFLSTKSIHSRDETHYAIPTRPLHCTNIRHCRICFARERKTTRVECD